MTITSGTNVGTGSGSTSGSTMSINTSATVDGATQFAILRVATDNVQTTDGVTTLHSSVTINAAAVATGTVTKLGEYTNGQAGAAAGITTSLWLLEFVGTMAATTAVLTVNFSSAVVDKAGHLYRFGKASGVSIVQAGTTQTAAADGVTAAGSQTISGLASSSRLWLRSIGAELNSTTALTVTAGYTALATHRSQNAAAAVATAGEFLISTATTATSNPTLPAAADSASLFVALEESSGGGGTGSGSHADMTRGATASGTSHAVTFPASCAVGDMVLVICLTGAGSSHSLASSTGVTLTAVDLTNANVGTVNSRLKAYSGALTSATPTASFTTNVSTTTAFVVIRIAAAQAPNLAATPAAQTTGASGNMDPPDLVANAVSRSTMFIAVGGLEQIGTLPTAAPSGYSDLMTQSATTAALAVARKTVTAVNDNPGAFTNTTSSWGAITLAVNLGAAPAVTTNPSLFFGSTF